MAHSDQLAHHCSFSTHATDAVPTPCFQPEVPTQEAGPPRAIHREHLLSLVTGRRTRTPTSLCLFRPPKFWQLPFPPNTFPGICSANKGPPSDSWSHSCSQKTKAAWWGNQYYAHTRAHTRTHSPQHNSETREQKAASSLDSAFPPLPPPGAQPVLGSPMSRAGHSLQF